MKDFLKLGLGIVTSIAGFIEVGSLSTSAQAGAQYGFRLLWAVLAATLCLVVLAEMAGRLAAVSRHPLAAAVRERFGFRYQAIPLVAEIVLDTLVLAAEIGGACVALQLVWGISPPLLAVPVAFLVWLLIWRGRFSALENGISALGLVSLAFVVAAVRLGPDWSAVFRGFVPSFSREEPMRYGFLAVSILGVTLSPYLPNFIAIAALPILAGLPPLKLTILAMALTVLVLPFVVLPFLVVMNDVHYLGSHRNGYLGNAVVLLVIGLGALLALVVVPLEILGG